MFTAEQMATIMVCERTASVLSMLGSLFVVSAYVCYPLMRKPMNRLLVFAALGNVLANVGTLISTSALPAGPTERPSPLCVTQAFLLQWCVPLPVSRLQLTRRGPGPSWPTSPGRCA